MKKSLMIPAWVFLSFYLVSTAGPLHAQWQEIDVAGNPYLWLFDVQFINENTGYVVGEAPSQYGRRGYFYKTTDGGMTWTNYPLADSSVYIGPNYTVLFLNENTGFVAGAYSGNKIFKTTNGGLNWQGYPAPYYILGTQQYYDFSFINENTGYVSGRYGILAKTTDAGITWDSVPYRFPQAVRGVWFANENTGYVCVATYIYKTTDGSATWNIVHTMPLGFTSLSFINSNTGFACGYRGGDLYRAVVKTTDGGDTWNTIFESPLAGYGGFECVRLINADTGFVSGGGVFKTIDGGNSWVQLNIDFTPAWQYYYNNNFINGKTGFVTAVWGKIYKTETGGVVNIQNISTQIPDGFLITKIFPNPFNSKINIEFDINSGILNSSDGNFSCKVYDVRGSLVKEENFLIRSAGRYNLNLNFAGFNSGVFFVNIIANNLSTRPQKVILIK